MMDFLYSKKVPGIILLVMEVPYLFNVSNVEGKFGARKSVKVNTKFISKNI